MTSLARSTLVAAFAAVTVLTPMGRAEICFVESSQPLAMGGTKFEVATLGDLNGDGRPDLIGISDSYCQPMGGPCYGSRVYVGLNNGDGTFTQGLTLTAGHSLHDVTAADLDGDDDVDLAFANSHSDSPGGSGERDALVVRLNNGDGTFAPEVKYGADKTSRSIVASDLDGDGDVDLAVTGSSGTLTYLNDGAGSFTERVALGWSNDSVSVGDLNGDGAPDLVLCEGYLTLLINDGSANFSYTNVLVDGSPLMATMADLNGDNALDIVLACQGDDYDPGCSCRENAGLLVMLNDGTGNFVEDGRYGPPVPWGPSDVVTGDFDGDGDVDLFNSSGAVYVNAGDGTFSGDWSTSSNYPLTGDLDGDAKTDLLTVSWSGTAIRTYLNTCNPCPADFDGSGDVGFADLTQLLSVWGACTGCPEDLDDDVLAGFSDLTELLANWGPCAAE